MPCDRQNRSVALAVKNPPANAKDAGDSGSIPGLGRCPGGGNGNPLQYPCPGNPMDRGAWWATVHGVAKSQTRLSTHQHTAGSPDIPAQERKRSKQWVFQTTSTRLKAALPFSFCCSSCTAATTGPQVHTRSRREGVSTRAPTIARLWETRLALPRLLRHGYGSQGAPGGAAAKPLHRFHFLSSVCKNWGPWACKV